MAALVSLVSTGAAFAQDTPDQDVSPNTSVLDRREQLLNVQGIGAGGFRLYPSLAAGATYDDNIYSTEDDEVSDVIGVFRARMTGRSLWSRHGFSFDANVTRRQYADNSDESSTDYGALGRGLIQFGQRSGLNLQSSYAKRTERRRALQTAVDAVEPVRFEEIGATAALDLRQTKFRENIAFSFNRFDYRDALRADGMVIDQDFRDRKRYDIKARQVMRLQPAIEGFIEASRQWEEFSAPQPGFNALQNSDGWAIAGGAVFDINKVARGEFGVGYEKKDFDDPVFMDIEGVSVRGEIEAFVSGLTTVTLNVERDIRASGVLGAGGYYANGVRVRVDHELMRPLLLVFEGEYRRDSFRGIDRQDRLARAEVGLAYAFRRGIVAGLYYEHEDVDSGGVMARSDFSNNIVRFGIELRR